MRRRMPVLWLAALSLLVMTAPGRTRSGPSPREAGSGGGGPVRSIRLTGTSTTEVAIPFADGHFYDDFTRCWHLPPSYPSGGSSNCKAAGHDGGDDGNDYSMSTGTKLYAMFHGTVTWINQGGSDWGLRIFLKLSNGWYIAYGHLSKIAAGLEQGQHGKAGQLIAISGESGDATGPHVEVQLIGPDGVALQGSKGSPDKTYGDFVDPRLLLWKVFHVNESQSNEKPGRVLTTSSVAYVNGCTIWNWEFDESVSGTKDHGYRMKNPPKCPT